MCQLEARPNSSLQRYWKMRLQDGPLLPMVSYTVASPTRPGAPKLTCVRVGGVVGENSFKNFVQFVAYAFFYCLFVVVVTAIYLSEDLSTTVCLLSQPTLLYHFLAFADLSPVRTERSLCGTCCCVWILWPLHFWDDMQLTTVRFRKPHDNRKLEQKTPRMDTCCTNPTNVQPSSTG